MGMDIGLQAQKLRYYIFFPAYLCGLGVVTNSGELAGKKSNLYNVIFCTFSLSCLAMVFTHDYVYPNNA